MISATELAALQAVATASLDQSATIQRKGVGSGGQIKDAYGSITDDFGTNATVMCNLAAPNAPMLQQYAERIGDLQAWVVRLPAGTTIARDDQILVAGLTLRVQALLAPQSYSACERVLATQVR